MRTFRGAGAALVVTGLAAGAHLAGGGRARADVLLAVLIGTWAVSSALAARRLTTAQLVGLLVLGQVVVHAVGSTDPTATHGAGMLLAHVAGTVLSAWVLRRGEDLLSGLADRLVLRFAAPLAVAVPCAPVRVEAFTSTWTPHGTLRGEPVEERGPPVGVR